MKTNASFLFQRHADAGLNAVLESGIRLFAAAAVCSAQLLAQSAQAKDIWVEADYNGSSDGTYSRPWKSIGEATDIHPGDVINVRPGIYRESVWLVSGTPDAWVTYRSTVRGGAKIIGPRTGDKAHIGAFHYWGGPKGTSRPEDADPSAWRKSYGKETLNAGGYVNIENFDITSELQDGNGIWFQWAHHIAIRNNNIHDCGGAGIGTAFFDYVTIEGNVINDNSKGTTDGFGSGISFYKTRPWDYNSGDHNIIRNNFIYHNHNNLSAPKRSDGNGIIIDTTPFDLGTLIENNVIYDNGGAGIMLAAAANVTVRYNTLYKNAWDENTRYPEIYMQQVTWDGKDGDPYTDDEQENVENASTKNCFVYANVISARRNRITVQINPDTEGSYTFNNLRWYDGQSYPSNVPDVGDKGPANETTSSTDIEGDPAFVAASTNPWEANFRLQNWSAALNGYTGHDTSDSKDVDGEWRSKGTCKDLGAYESF